MLNRYFKLDAHGTTVRRELLAGVTTFITMAYIIIVNPKILEAAGMPFGASMAATILTAFFGTMFFIRIERRRKAWPECAYFNSPRQRKSDLGIKKRTGDRMVLSLRPQRSVTHRCRWRIRV